MINSYVQMQENLHELPGSLKYFLQVVSLQQVYVAVDKRRCICSCLPLWNVDVLPDLLNVSHQVPGGVLL